MLPFTRKSAGMASDLSNALALVMGNESFASAMKRFADAFVTYRERLPRNSLRLQPNALGRHVRV